ncbi:MAG: signal peptide peptidase SppA [Deltaproteobacteria bacterium]|nr:signal peptide peptidase SppA [Deltaproteobacteria bacterium]
MHVLEHLRLIVPLVVALSLVLVVILVRQLRRWRAVPTGAWLRVRLDGGLVELHQPIARWQRWIGRKSPLSLSELRRTLNSAAKDPKIAGIILEIHSSLAVSWPLAQSLCDALERVRATRKPTVAWLPHGADNAALLLACACDRAYASPPATLGPLGQHMAQHYVRPLLDRLGVQVEVLARTEYKSAADSLTREDMSPANREQLEAILETRQQVLHSALTQRRGLSAEKADAVIDHGPMRTRVAVERGVFDGAMYEDELLKLLGADKQHASTVSFHRYTKARVKVPRIARGKLVGVIELRGPIVLKGRANGERMIDVEHTTQALRAAAASSFVGAVVLHIDSPGGSALASDLIAREVEQLAAVKPVVAYFGDVAASGGYYIAAGARHIIAQPTSITGSIGVIAMRFVVSKLLAQAGIGVEQISRGKNAGIFAPYRTWSDDERALMDQSIDETYEDFLAVVAKGRKRTRDQIEPLARGRVWSGRDALGVGLVDQLGDLTTAIAFAAQSAGILQTEIAIKVEAPKKHLGPIKTQPTASDAALEVMSAWLGRERPWLRFAQLVGSEEILALDTQVAGLT